MQVLFCPSNPYNKRPILRSEGYPLTGIPVFTKHEYVGTRKEPDPEFGDLRPQWAHLFACTQTGVVRVFGVDGPNYLGGDQ